MRKSLLLPALLFVLILFLVGVKSKAGSVYVKENCSELDSLPKTSAEKLVQEQLDAYNARNIDAFLAPYSDSVELYEYPDKLIGKGKAQMRQMYTDLFNKVTNLHCELVNRMVLGNTVIDYESVTGFGPKPVRAIAVYTVEGNKISKVRFID